MDRRVARVRHPARRQRVREAAGHRAGKPVRVVVPFVAAAIVSALLVVALPAGTASASPPHWTVVHSPNRGSTDVLYGVSCPGPTWCVAVGNYEVGNSVQSLVESWDGTTWSVSPTPDTGLYGNQLQAVSCVSPTDCVAVGRVGNGTTFILMWDGDAWSVAPTSSGTEGSLLGVSCTSSTNCVAVGSDNGAFIETWDGNTWTVTDNNGSSLYGGALSSVSCVSSISCLAVGWDINPSTEAYSPLVETWDGSDWLVVSTAALNASRFYGVDCTSTTNCLVVGEGSTLETWNGTTWTSEGSNDGFVNFYSIACPDTTCTIGAHNDIKNHAWLYSFIGTFPIFVPEPRVHGTFYGVSCPSTISCVAVGNQGHKTLIETGYPDVYFPKKHPWHVGASVAVSGYGFVPSSTCTVFWDDISSEPLATAQVDSDGRLATSITVPPTSVGKHTVLVEDPVSGVVVPARLTVK